MTKGTSIATFNLYIDGIDTTFTASNTLTGEINSNTEPIRIGIYGDTPAYQDQLNGTIYDIKIFNKTLTQAEVTYLNQTKCQMIPSTAITNCIIDMRFEDKQGTTAIDRSGNNYNGTLTEFTNTTLGASNSWVDKYNNSITVL